MPELVALCLGAIGCGKTTLLRKLQPPRQEDEEEVETEPLPTVGINHFNIEVNDYLQEEKKTCLSAVKLLLTGKPKPQYLTVREFGGSLAPAWLNYLNGHLSANADQILAGILYVIDVSSTARYSEVGVHLTEVIGLLEKEKSPTRVLIVLSKLDLVEQSCQERLLNEARALLRLQHLSDWCKYCFLDIVEYSSVSGQGLTIIQNWCNDLVN